MSNEKVVRQNFENNYSGKDGNLWDYLVDQDGDNSSAGGNTNTGGNTSGGSQNPSQNTGGQTGTGGTTTYVDQDGNVVTVPNSPDGSSPGTSNSQGVVIVTQEVEQPEMTDTIKYLIVFLAVLSVALIIVIVYVATRMCSRRTTKVERRLSVKDLDPQYVIEADGAKDIFNGRKRKGNKHADAVESTSGGGQRSISSSEMKLRPAVNVDTVNGDEGYTAQDQHTVPDTDRGFNSARPGQ